MAKIVVPKSPGNYVSAEKIPYERQKEYQKTYSEWLIGNGVRIIAKAQPNGVQKLTAYTCPIGKRFLLSFISFAGFNLIDNTADFIVAISGNDIMDGITQKLTPFNITFPFPIPIFIETGEKITIEQFNADSHSQICIIGYELPASVPF